MAFIDLSKQSQGKLAAGIDKADKATKTSSNGPGLAKGIGDTIKGLLRTALFMEALRNLNWSRGYCWYVEMDGVPNPFQRGGVLGLPCKNVTFKIAEGSEYTFPTSSVETLKVPRAMGELGVITLDMYDDEQQTLARFFERWYNQIYNPYNGVLPLTEACKQITIYKQKSTRKNVRRAYYNIDSTSLVDLAFGWLTKGKVKRETEGYDFLVFPSSMLQFSWGTDSNELNTLSVTLQIAHFCNQDFGNPSDASGFTDILGITSGNNHLGASFLDKLADYI